MKSSGRRAAMATLLLLFGILPAGPAAPVTAEKVRSALPELNAFAEQILKKTGVPGMALAVVHDDRVVHLQGFGVRQVGKEGRVDPDTVFQLASVSKPLTSTVMAALVGEKLITWDDRILDHDPAFQMYDPWVTRALTFRDLLCHRSGLPDHAGDLLEDLGYDRAQVLHRLRFLKPASSFRSQYAYTNFGFTEAAVAAARMAGKSWEDLAAEKLFRPLGMKSSSYRFADYAAAENRARLHVRVEGRWLARHVRQPDAQAPAGGASSSVRDLASWLRLHLSNGTFEGRSIVGSAALGETHRPQIVSNAPKDPAADRAGFYGLGWNVNYDEDGRVRLGHSGAFSLGAATAVSLLPSEKLGIIVLTNGYPIGVPEAVSATFFDLVLKGKVERDWLLLFRPLFDALATPEYRGVDLAKPPAKPSPALPLFAYVGRYANVYFGDIEVMAKGESLVLRMGPRGAGYPMRHWNRDVFAYQPPGENAGGASAVTFWVGSEGKATRVVVENLDVEGHGTFRRREAKR